MAKKIAIIEDEAELAALLEYNLTRQGLVTRILPGSKGAIEELEKWRPDLIILDVMLPDGDGFELCRELRKNSLIGRTPVVFLTARSDEVDRVLGLEIGGDDYVTKPFSPRELVLRIKKILQRGQLPTDKQDAMRFGDLAMDLPRHLVTWKGKAFDLTATEFKLLTVLAQRAGRVQTRDALLRDVWEYDAAIDTRTVDTHMRRLREKLGPAAKHLDTVRGVGYRFVE